MQTNDHAASRDLGRDSYEIQQDLLIAAVKFVDSLVRKLKKSNSIRKDAPSPVISISLGGKKLTRQNAPANGVTLASSLSEADLDYIEKAMRMPASKEVHPDLDQDLTISVDGKDVLVVKDGVVTRNDLFEREVSRWERPTHTVSRETAPRSTEESEQNTAPPDTSSEPEVVEAEVVDDSQERVPSGEKEAPSPIILILTREIERRTPETPLRNDVISFFETISKAPRDFLSNVQSRFAQARSSVLNYLHQDNDPQNKDFKHLSVLAVAHELLDRYGQMSGGRDVFDGNLYRIDRVPHESLTITAKDGRGTIFSQEEGVVSENLTSLDYDRFSQVAQHLEAGRSVDDPSRDFERE